MYVSLGKGGFVMAGIAEVRLLGGQELCIFARMRIVASGASFADGRMDDLSREARLVMTAVAQFRLGRRKPFGDPVLFFVGDHPRIDRGVACGAAHGNGSMNTFPLRHLLMALQAVVFRIRGRGGDEERCKKNEQKDHRVHMLFLL
jgi:hypothetical protein